MLPLISVQFAIGLFLDIGILFITLSFDVRTNRIVLLLQAILLTVMYIHGTFLTKGLGVIGLSDDDGFTNSLSNASVIVTAVENDIIFCWIMGRIDLSNTNLLVMLIAQINWSQQGINIRKRIFELLFHKVKK